MHLPMSWTPAIQEARRRNSSAGLRSEAEPDSEGLLLHGVYAYGENKGVDEPNLWGDYFYMEGLLRLANPDWIPFL